jgi:hypothetical protein
MQQEAAHELCCRTEIASASFLTLNFEKSWTGWLSGSTRLKADAEDCDLLA